MRFLGGGRGTFDSEAAGVSGGGSGCLAHAHEAFGYGAGSGFVFCVGGGCIVIIVKKRVM